MTKHRVQSIAERQAAQRKYFMCRIKTKFPTQAAAFQKGQRAYHCPHCGHWHRTSKV